MGEAGINIVNWVFGIFLSNLFTKENWVIYSGDFYDKVETQDHKMGTDPGLTTAVSAS